MSDKDLSIWNSSFSQWQRWHGTFSMYECFCCSTRCCIAASWLVLTISAQFCRLFVAGHQAHPDIQLLKTERARFVLLPVNGLCILNAVNHSCLSLQCLVGVLFLSCCLRFAASQPPAMGQQRLQQSVPAKKRQSKQLPVRQIFLRIGQRYSTAESKFEKAQK
jgi:hypothetical protein